MQLLICFIMLVQMKGREEYIIEERKDLLEHIPNQIRVINEKYIELCHLIGQNNNPCFALSRFVGKIFVTF